MGFGSCFCGSSTSALIVVNTGPFLRLLIYGALTQVPPLSSRVFSSVVVGCRFCHRLGPVTPEKFYWSTDSRVSLMLLCALVLVCSFSLITLLACWSTHRIQNSVLAFWRPRSTHHFFRCICAVVVCWWTFTLTTFSGVSLQ